MSPLKHILFYQTTELLLMPPSAKSKKMLGTEHLRKHHLQSLKKLLARTKRLISSCVPLLSPPFNAVCNLNDVLKVLCCT